MTVGRFAGLVLLAAALPAVSASKATTETKPAVQAILYDRGGTERNDECGAIWSVDPAGGRPTPVIDRGNRDCDPDWAPDGQRFAFASYRAGAQAIYLADATGKNIVRVSNPSPDEKDFTPAWSPDGTSIAFEREHLGNFALYLVQVDGSHERLLAGGNGFDGTPSWSPDGRVLFVSDRPHGQSTVCPGCSALYVQRPNNTRAGRITRKRFNALTPSWSRDGAHIAWARGASILDQVLSVYVMRSNTTGARRIDVAGGSPAWSPDSRQIIYSSGGGLVVVNLDGSGRHRLTRDGGDGPSWRPLSPP